MKKSMKQTWSLLMAMLLVVTTIFLPVHAEEVKDAPKVNAEQIASGTWPNTINLPFGDDSYMKAIAEVSVDDVAYTHRALQMSDSSSDKAWNVESILGATGRYNALKVLYPRALGENAKGVVLKIKANGYKDQWIRLSKDPKTPYYAQKYLAEDVTPVAKTYQVNIGEIKNGSLTLSQEKGLKEGDKVIVTPAAQENYEFEAITGTSESGKSLALTAEGDQYSFLMPAENVTLSATFKEKKQAKSTPDKVLDIETSSFPNTINLNFGDESYTNAITAVSVNGKDYAKEELAMWSDGDLWYVKDYYGRLDRFRALSIMYPRAFDQGAVTLVIKADGYADMTVKLSREGNGYPYSYKAEILKDGDKPQPETPVDPKPEKPDQPQPETPDDPKPENPDNPKPETPVDPQPSTEDKTIGLADLTLTKSGFGNKWSIGFKNADDYAANLTSLKVNDKAWEERPFEPSSGGRYYKNTDRNEIILAATDFSSSGENPIIKSGDVITLSAKGYKDLTVKFVVDSEGNASLIDSAEQGDPYELRLKLEGSFEAAIVGQKDYDGVSSASGISSSNKNSSVTVYAAVVEKGKEPEASDWKELDHRSDVHIQPDSSKVTILGDKANGTPENAESGMEGVYLTISSSLTLRGTPKTAGQYLISVSATDTQGRHAVSNALPLPHLQW